MPIHPNLVLNGLFNITDNNSPSPATPVGLTVLNNDLKFGLAKEVPVIEKLSIHFEENIIKSEYQYAPHDAYSDKTKYEIKSRRNTYRAFPTTILPTDKIRELNGCRLVAVFNFTDGLYYIVYDPVRFASYEIKDIEAYRRGGMKTLKPHFHIPIGDLIRIHI